MIGDSPEAEDKQQTSEVTNSKEAEDEHFTEAVDAVEPDMGSSFEM